MDMAGSFPDSGMGYDCAINAHHILSLLDKCLPESLFYVVLHLNTQWTIIKEARKSSIDFTILEDEALLLAEGCHVLDGKHDQGIFKRFKKVSNLSVWKRRWKVFCWWTQSIFSF